MPNRCSWALNCAFTSSGSGRLNQLLLYTSKPCCMRSSRATMSITLTCPPWPFSRSSFLIPARATQAPISVHKAMMVAGDKVSVPAKDVCSVLKPIFCGGRNSTGRSAGNCGSAASITPCNSAASTFSGRCGPCCSTAATGNMAIVSAARPFVCASEKSCALTSAQSREGQAAGVGAWADEDVVLVFMDK